MATKKKRKAIAPAPRQGGGGRGEGVGQEKARAISPATKEEGTMQKNQVPTRKKRKKGQGRGTSSLL